MEQSPEQHPGQQQKNSWKIALALVCMGILAYGFFYSKNSASNFAYLIGYNLLPSLFIWGIFYAIFFRKKKGGKVAGLSFLAIYSTLIASSLIGFYQQKHELKQVITEIQKQYSAIYESLSDSQGILQLIDKRVDTTPKSKGEFGEIERLIKEFMYKMVSQRNDYLQELDRIGWENVLNPQRTNMDKSLVESKITIQKAKEIVNKYRTKTKILLETTRKEMENLDISESYKEEILSGFDKRMEESRKQIDILWGLEEKIILEIEKIIVFLSARKGSWVVSEGQILFDNNNDLNRFNSYIASIQDLTRQQEVIQQRKANTVNKILTRRSRNRDE